MTKPNKRVLVVGDVMLDHYVLGDVQRVSPEAPVPILLRSDQDRYLLGGAGNVARGIRALDANVTLVGVVGQDKHADLASKCCRVSGVDAQLLVVAEALTTVKTRFVTRQQQLLRVDLETPNALTDETKDRFLNVVKEILDSCSYDAIVISDYAKGVVTPAVGKLLTSWAPPVFVDPKPGNLEAYAGCYLIKPNKSELFQLVRSSPQTCSILSACNELWLRTGGAHVFVTCGEDGGSLFTNEGNWYTPVKATDPVLMQDRTPVDVVGAGDTALAAFVAAHINGKSSQKCLDIANIASERVVRKSGTAVIFRKELADVWED